MLDFTIIVPVYNAKLFLDECVNSIINQQEITLEVLLVDDGSDDGSELLCNNLKEKDNRIKVFHKENGGQISARKCGINHAQGKYLVFVDADDKLKENSLKVIKTTFEETNCDCILYGLEINDNSHVLDVWTDEYCVFKESDKSELFMNMFLDQKKNSMCRKAMRREVASNINLSEFYYLRHGEDLIQSILIYKNSNKVVVIPDILYIYRYNLLSTSHKWSPSELIDFSVLEYILEFINENQVFNDEDKEKYLVHCYLQFIDRVRRICKADFLYKKKENLLKNIRESNFYEILLKNKNCKKNIKNKKKLFLALYNVRAYKLMCIFNKWL